MIRIVCVLVLACTTALFAQQPRPAPDVKPPAILEPVKPDFSKCRAAGMDTSKSQVIVSLWVREDGSADLTGIDEGSGNACVDEEALRIVKQYKFRPAMKDGQPIAVHLQVKVAIQITQKS